MPAITINRTPEWSSAEVLPPGAVIKLPGAISAPLLAAGEAVETPGAAVTHTSPFSSEPLSSAYTDAFAPTRGSALEYATQFRGAADTSGSLGQLGLTVNEASASAAGSRLAASDSDWASTVNGASLTGQQTVVIGPFPSNVLRVHLAQLGLAGPYVNNDSGPVLAASMQLATLVFDTALNIRCIEISVGPPTNFAGVSGTGSARTVSVRGLALPA